MKTIQNTIRQLRYQELVTGLLLAAFYRLLLEGRIIRGVSLIDQPQEVPVGGYPPDRIITENSAEWRLIYKATKQADEEITRWWSPRSGEAIAYWYANSEYMFVFYSTQGDSGVYAGVTDIEFGSYLNLPFGTQQAVHLSLRDQQGKPT